MCKTGPPDCRHAVTQSLLYIRPEKNLGATSGLTLRPDAASAPEHFRLLVSRPVDRQCGEKEALLVYNAPCPESLAVCLPGFDHILSTALDSSENAQSTTAFNAPDMHIMTAAECSKGILSMMLFPHTLPSSTKPHISGSRILENKII